MLEHRRLINGKYVYTISKIKVGGLTNYNDNDWIKYISIVYFQQYLLINKLYLPDFGGRIEWAEAAPTPPSHQPSDQT